MAALNGISRQSMQFSFEVETHVSGDHHGSLIAFAIGDGVDAMGITHYQFERNTEGGVGLKIIQTFEQGLGDHEGAAFMKSIKAVLAFSVVHNLFVIGR
jgi:hypothetical protein